MNPIRLASFFPSAVFVSAVLLAACGASSQQQAARVRVVHLSPDAPPIDAFVDQGQRVVTGLPFGSSSESAAVPLGRRTFEIKAAGSPTSAAIATLDGVLFEQDRDYTAFAFGKLGEIAVAAFEDSTQGLASNNVRLRVTHAADGVGVVNVLQVPAAGAPFPLAASLRYGTSSPTVDLPTDPFVVGLDLDNDQKPDLLFDIPALPRGTVVNVFAALDRSGAPFLLAQLGGSTIARIDPEVAQVRVLHLSPNAPTVQAFFDSVSPPGYAPISFTQSTPYTSLSATTHRLDISASGTASGAALSIPAVQLEAGRKYTAVAVGNVASLGALFFENGATGLASQNVRIRAIHAALGVGPVNIYSLAPDGTIGAALLTNVRFSNVSDPIDLPSGAYTLGIDANNDGNPDLYFEVPSLPPGTVANLYVTQDASGKVFALAQLDDATTLRIDASTSKLRVVHISRNAPAVDVYANGTRVVASLAYASTTAMLTVPSGAYDLDVTPAGSSLTNAVIKTHGTPVLPGRAYSVVAYGDLPNITAEVLEDDLSGINSETDIRLNVIHVAPTVTRGDIYAIKPTGNTLLAANIGFGDHRRIPDLPSSSYEIGFDAESNGTIDIAFMLPVLAPGSFANVFVATDAENKVYVLVQTTGAGTIRVDATP